MKTRIAESAISETLHIALERNGLIGEEDTAIIFYNLDFLDERLDDLNRTFPSNSLHTIAVKANPLVKILEHIQTKGFGLEVASLPELHLALNTGIAPEKIVFDSPAKTIREIEYALEHGILLNADSFAELDRIADVLKTMKSSSNIGVRINPQTGTGAIKATSVAERISKFGIPINTNRNKLIQYFIEHDWISVIHLHVGSQGIPLKMMVDGIERVFELLAEINRKLHESGKSRRLSVFDIGGGLPVSYHHDNTPADLSDYKNLIESRVPGLFSNEFKIITEFGRFVHANSGWVASRIEYVKKEKDYNIIITHVGADLFLRKSYNPNDWHHEMTVFDYKGRLKKDAKKIKYIVAGPLCFGGDIIAKDVFLPEAEEGDFLIIQDTGAYNLSMWSRYNSRQIPLILAYSEKADEFNILKKRETPEDLAKFWK